MSVQKIAYMIAEIWTRQPKTFEIRNKREPACHKVNLAVKQTNNVFKTKCRMVSLVFKFIYRHREVKRSESEPCFRVHVPSSWRVKVWKWASFSSSRTVIANCKSMLWPALSPSHTVIFLIKTRFVRL